MIISLIPLLVVKVRNIGPWSVPYRVFYHSQSVISYTLPAQWPSIREPFQSHPNSRCAYCIHQVPLVRQSLTQVSKAVNGDAEVQQSFRQKLKRMVLKKVCTYLRMHDSLSRGHTKQDWASSTETTCILYHSLQQLLSIFERHV